MYGEKHGYDSVVSAVLGIQRGSGNMSPADKGEFLYHKIQLALPPKHSLNLITILHSCHRDPH